MANNITLKRAVLHILDNAGGVSVVSDKAITMSGEIGDYLSKHITKCFSDFDVKHTEFIDDSNNQFLSIVQAFNESDDLLNTSKLIAKKFIDVMIDGTTISSGDLLVVDFMNEGNMYLGILKFNYKYSYIHYVESEDGIRNNIIKQPCTLPIETQKLDEFIIINLSDYSLIVKEKKYEVNGVKESYITKYILNSIAVISDKEAVDLVEKTARKVIQDEYNNDMGKLHTFKKALIDDFAMTSEIDLDNIADKTFEDESGKRAFREGILSAGIQESKIKISPNAEKRMVKKQKLVTDLGIEIAVPSSLLSDNEVIEFINNVNGTISIVIKNVGTINSN